MVILAVFITNSVISREPSSTKIVILKLQKKWETGEEREEPITVLEMIIKVLAISNRP